MAVDVVTLLLMVLKLHVEQLPVVASVQVTPPQTDVHCSSGSHDVFVHDVSDSA